MDSARKLLSVFVSLISFWIL